MKKKENKLRFKSIGHDEFGEYRKLMSRQRSPDIDSILSAAGELKAKEGFVVENWDRKERPVAALRRYLPERKWSERRLPSAGEFAVLRMK